MNKEEMSKIIATALKSYSWGTYRNTALPDYIAHLISCAQALEEQPVTSTGFIDYDKLRSDLKDATVKLGVANDVLEKQRIELIEAHVETERLNKHLDRAEGHKTELRGEIAQLLTHERTHIENLDKQRTEIAKLRVELKAKTLNDRDTEILRLRRELREQGELFSKACSEKEREKASNLDLKNKLKESEEQYQAKVLLTNDLMHKLEEARAAQPHFYQPSAAHMGDCFICGNTRDAPQHKAANWKERALAAEHNHQIAKDRLKELTDVADALEGELKDAIFRAEVAEKRADNAEATIAAIKGAMR